MTKQVKQLSRYHCVICGRRVRNAREAYIREDRPYGARLCREHAQVIAEYFADGVITTLRLAVIRKRLRQAGYHVDVQAYQYREQGYSREESREILSKILD